MKTFNYIILILIKALENINYMITIDLFLKLKITKHKLNTEGKNKDCNYIRFVRWICPDSPPCTGASSFTRFLDHTQWRTAVGSSPGRVISSSQRLLSNKTQHTDFHAPGGIRTHHLSRRGAANTRINSRGY
jgi:hypothetical protein